MGSINAQSNLTNTQKAVANSLSKLSSGYRVSKAADDAAGLAISEKMRGQISGLKQAANNAQSAISLIQTGEGGLSESQSILQRMRELAVQSSSDTNTDSDRVKIQAEVDQLATEVTRISNTTEFNTQNLLAGGLNNTFHIGANEGQSVSLAVGAMDAFSLGVAGQSNTQGTTSGGSFGISTVTRVGNGLTSQTYKLQTTRVDATTAAAGSSGAGTTGAAGTVGTIGAASGVNGNGSGYTGALDAQLRIKITGVVIASGGSGSPTSISVSFDGGRTYGASVTYASGMNIGKGLTWEAGSGSYATGNIISATFTAAKATVQLQDASGVSIGNAVAINNEQTTATIGNANTGETMDIYFEAGAIVSGASANFQTVTTSYSSAAITSNGDVTTAAVTQAGIDVSSQSAANAAITAIDNAIKTVSEERSKLGAMQNRLEHTINNLGTSAENLTSAESNIRDVDMAAEMSSFTKSQVLAQAGVAMLAQANQAPQTILKLLQ
jgi:flagellin